MAPRRRPSARNQGADHLLRRLLGRVRSWRRSRPARWLRSVRDWHLERRRPGSQVLRAFAKAYPSAYFIQIGSNDGEQLDPLRKAIARRAWTGVMVEPVPYVFRRLRGNYGHLAGRIALENVAVGERDGEVPFYHLAPVEDHEAAGLPQWYDAIGSFDRDHVVKHAPGIPDLESRLVTSVVPTVSFETLCRRHGVGQLDLLHMDVEGYDLQLLRSIDLGRWKPRLLIYEHFHLSEPDQRECRQLLAEHGYEVLEDGMDTWCLDPSGSVDVRLNRVWRRVTPRRSA